ncbi:Homeodomain [Fragilaria crotonensis]|nr:Homeodomain [Fragilaria crotonensis]
MDSPSSRRARSSSSVSTSSTTSSLKGKASQRKSSSLPSETVEYLKAWMMSPDHVAHPYPTEQEKAQIMSDTGIELKQLTNWFVNNRKRFWKPRVEARLQHQPQVQVVAVVTPSTTTHLVSPGSERPACDAVQQPAPTPYFTLDMTLPVPIEQETPAVPCVPVAPAVPSFPVGTGAFSTFPSALPRTVSDASSSGSDENGSEDDSNEEQENEVTDEYDESTGDVIRTESVDVHILRPLNGGTPSIEDVTILSNVPASRVIRSYRNTMMAYAFPQDMATDRKKVRSRRDGEIVRIKKHFLRVFLTETPLAPCRFVPVTPTKRKREKIEKSCDPADVDRSKCVRRKAPTTWRDACKDAPHFRDDALPSLEEAARLFGYAQ